MVDRYTKVALTVIALSLMYLVNACGSGSTPQFAAVLDSLAPGVELGALAGPAAARLHLPVFSYGYGDTAAAPSRGIKGIGLMVHADSSLEPSPLGRIKAVWLGLPTRAAALALRDRLTRDLGRPERACLMTGYVPARQVAYHWPDAKTRGVYLMVPLDSTRLATVIFSMMPLDENISDLGDTPAGCVGL